MSFNKNLGGQQSPAAGVGAPQQQAMAGGAPQQQTMAGGAPQQQSVGGGSAGPAFGVMTPEQRMNFINNPQGYKYGYGQQPPSGYMGYGQWRNPYGGGGRGGSGGRGQAY
jgi:hypothetical protein